MANYHIYTDGQFEFDLPDSNLPSLEMAQIGREVELVSMDLRGKTAIIKVRGKHHHIRIQTPLEKRIEELGLAEHLHDDAGEIHAPMPGKVLEILASEGQEVEEGSPLLILEAMKMENIIKSVSTGTVKSIHVEKAQTVDKAQLLITIE